jgi:ribosome-binding protein aMBF1 (putative translation factor)
MNVWSSLVGNEKIPNNNRGKHMVTKAKKPRSKRDIKALVGVQVRRLRKEKGISQQELADKCGIFRTYLSRVENGDANPTVTVLAALAVSLNVSIGELIVEQ